MSLFRAIRLETYFESFWVLPWDCLEVSVNDWSDLLAHTIISRCRCLDVVVIRICGCLRFLDCLDLLDFWVLWVVWIVWIVWIFVLWVVWIVWIVWIFGLSVFEIVWIVWIFGLSVFEIV